ncbi:MAG: DNA-directed RNA polymerase subunit H [Candidatus Heimdallarchaeaceae archaeon]
MSGTNPLFNIFDHIMVPLHIKLEDDEVEEVLKKYQIKKHQLPKILDSDPAIKAIQAKPGDIIKIIRNPNMGEAGVYYRYVIRSTSRLRLAAKTQRVKEEM